MNDKTPSPGDTLRTILKRMHENSGQFDALEPEARALMIADVLRMMAQHVEEHAAEVGSQFSGLAVMLVDTNEDFFTPQFATAGMRPSTAIALLDICKTRLIQTLMRDLDEPEEDD